MMTPTKLVDDLCSVKSELLHNIEQRKAKTVDKYVWIQTQKLPEAIKDENWQSAWSDFYRLNTTRLSKEKKKHFYEIFYDYWVEDRSYEDLITSLLNVNQRVESSFSSKIQHTKNPNSPIIDSEVARVLGWDLPGKKSTNAEKIADTVRWIERLTAFYETCFTKDGWTEVSQHFDEVLAVDGFQYTEIKKIDILLWQRNALIKI